MWKSVWAAMHVDVNVQDIRECQKKQSKEADLSRVFVVGSPAEKVFMTAGPTWAIFIPSKWRRCKPARWLGRSVERVWRVGVRTDGRSDPSIALTGLALIDEKGRADERTR